MKDMLDNASSMGRWHGWCDQGVHQQYPENFTPATWVHTVQSMLESGTVSYDHKFAQYVADRLTTELPPEVVVAVINQYWHGYLKGYRGTR